MLRAMPTNRRAGARLGNRGGLQGAKAQAMASLCEVADRPSRTCRAPGSAVAADGPGSQPGARVNSLAARPFSSSSSLAVSE